MSYILEALRKVEQERESLPVRRLSSRRRYTTVVSTVIPRQKTLIIVVAALIGALVSGTLSTYLTADREVLPKPSVGQTTVQPSSTVPGLGGGVKAVINSDVKQTSVPEPPLDIKASRYPTSAGEGIKREGQVEVKKTSRDVDKHSVGTLQKRIAHVDRQIRHPLPSVKDVHTVPNDSSSLSKERKTPAVPPSLSALPLQPQGMPEIKVDGIIYSSDPGKSVVIINTQLYSEGQTTPDGITVEAIRQDGVICSYHGQRFRLSR